MGVNEDQLKAMGTADAVWKIEEFSALESQMAQLKADMAAIAKNPGWTGTSAEAASTHFLKLKTTFDENEAKLANARAAISKANTVRAEAAAKLSSLPDSSVPDWVHVAALVGGNIIVPGIGTFAAEVAVQKVNEFMGSQREAAALEALTTMKSELEAPNSQLAVNAISGEAWPEAPPAPDWPTDPIVWGGDDTGAGAWSTDPKSPKGGGGGGLTEIGGVLHPEPRPPKPPVIVEYPPYPPIVLPPEQPEGWPHDFVSPPEISIDGDSGNGSNPGGLLGGGSGGIGLGLAGAGAAGIGAAKLASKGGFGGGGLFGPNGLLGGGAGGAGGANGSGGGAGSKSGVVGAGAGAGAGSKGGNSAMMGGGQGGGSSDKEKRTSLGLMAPKLEDDEENGPRSSAAGAGGRE